MHQKHPPPKTAVCSLAMVIRCPQVREVTFLPHRSSRATSSGRRPRPATLLPDARDARLSTASTEPASLNLERHHVPISILTFAIVECHALIFPVAGELVSSDQNQMFAVANVQLQRPACCHHAQQCLRRSGAVHSRQFALDEPNRR